jgi:hypothetical protein
MVLSSRYLFLFCFLFYFRFFIWEIKKTFKSVVDLKALWGGIGYPIIAPVASSTA